MGTWFWMCVFFQFESLSLCTTHLVLFAQPKFFPKRTQITNRSSALKRVQELVWRFLKNQEDCQRGLWTFTHWLLFFETSFPSACNLPFQSAFLWFDGHIRALVNLWWLFWITTLFVMCMCMTICSWWPRLGCTACLQFPGCFFLPLINQLHWDIFHSHMTN